MNDRNAVEKLFARGNSYWLTRFVILRLLGFVYAIAFFIAAKQLVPLIGDHGLTPATHFLSAIEAQLGSRSAGTLHLPTLFWFGLSDRGLSMFAWIGFALSLVVLGGYANAILLTLLWSMYMSIVHVGQIWYGYGWEIQLLETGFLSIFLCPLIDGRPFPKCRPPILIIWLFRWLGFRIMVGAGLIKLRGDACWRDLTCLYYHYETQPIPNPISRYLHFAPHWFHKLGTAWNHCIELIVPWFSFYPRLARHIAGVLLISFQIILIISGNLSFLNYVTIIPFLACFDDTLLSRILPKVLVRQAKRRAAESQTSHINNRIAVALSILVAYLSVAPVINMASGQQLMNYSFNPLDLVNTYGAFGTVGRERDEIIFEGTDDAVITGDTKWKEYEFLAKPGDPNRRPPFVAPYQPRIDWQIWFAAMSSPAEYPWTLHFVWKLLHNDRGTLSLIANNPFPDAPPRYIRARLFRYHFAPLGEKAWWQREPIGEWLPALSPDDAEFRRLLAAMDWLD
ncbi:MAG TPA: lipase maturation factor family protein [Chthoniobacterales bacterium]|nr:lipase maturation factor family protein [Chthoniobacterales bacterium]